ncbi:MAG: GNAT family N-acetyltransferase [Oscillospiraceae bacterium]
MDYTIHENELRTEDFIRLFAAAGWGECPRDLVDAALENSYATFSVKHGGEVIAMARLLGDGAMSFFLKDLIVAPEYQGKGIGSALLAHIEGYIRRQLKPGWRSFFELMSAKGKEAFYLKQGYTEHPGEHGGAGFSKWIEN